MQTVLVTGTSSGIGRATALHLAEQRFRVLAGVREVADGEALLADAPDGGGEPVPLIFDVPDEDEIPAAVAGAKEIVDRDGLIAVVNNAGLPVVGPPLVPDRVWDAVARRPFTR